MGAHVRFGRMSSITPAAQYHTPYKSLLFQLVTNNFHVWRRERDSNPRYGFP
jgi:hypothetical protein